MPKATILVVDDEPLIRWSLTERFRGEGYDVLQADSGGRALERIAEGVVSSCSIIASPTPTGSPCCGTSRRSIRTSSSSCSPPTRAQRRSAKRSSSVPDIWPANPSTSMTSVLTDYSQIPRFMPEVESSLGLVRSDNGVLVQQEAVARYMMFSKRIHLLLDIRQEDGTIRFRDRGGRSFARYEGAWTVVERDGATQITYELSAQPSFQVPEFLLKRDAVRMIERLKIEIAARTRRLTN